MALYQKKRIQIALIICLLPFGLFGQFDSLFHRKTLRMDYEHTGGKEKGTITFDKFIEEPWWGGSFHNLIDTFGYGRYHLEVKDVASSRVIYSRRFSTLFVEWQDTEEAKTAERSFKESVVMPFPRKEVVIVLYRRDKQNKLHELFRRGYHPMKDAVEQSTPLPYPVVDILVNGPTEKRLDVVIIAEGYTAAEREKFLRDCSRYAAYLLNASPFREHQHLISIRGIMAISDDSGVSLPDEGVTKNTALGASFSTLGSERYLMAEDFQRVRDVAALAPYDQIFILVNSDKYGGGGIFNFYATGTSDHPSGNFLLIHEFGHSFAGLADEYYTSDVAVQDFYDKKTEPWEPNITTLVNFGSKWASMVPAGTPIPTPATKQNQSLVGVYEGAGYAENGIYRPYLECTMKSVRYDGFCPVCRVAIARMILFYSE